MTRITGDWLDDPRTQLVCKLLEQAGHEALFVGGCVRNALMNAPVDDIDISTDALPDRVTEVFSRAGLRVIPTGINHGTVTVIADHLPHEITTFRRDVATDGRRAVVAFSTDLMDDARRRDFTMNALYARSDGSVIDPLAGLPDLRSRHVRFIEDAEQRIQEDYLRSLRFFRFSAWYGDPELGMDAGGLAAIAANLDGLGTLSRERITHEMLKLLRAPDPVRAVAAMQQTGTLQSLFQGGDTRWLGPLVHLEPSPDPIRRLAAIGVPDIEAHLRLSKAQARRLTLIRDAATGSLGSAELGYRIGGELAFSAVLLRSAFLEAPLPPNLKQDIETGANAVFPVRPKDLVQRFQGKELGDRLRALEADWIESGFTLSRQSLLGG